MSDTIYIHYGNNVFDPSLVHGPHNAPDASGQRNKPRHALWASPEDSDQSWKIWCESEEFRLDDFDECFRFKLKDTSKIFVVDSQEKEQKIPRRPGHSCRDHYLAITGYDFDALKNSGYDAIEVKLSNCWQLYNDMYGWDCDSIAILNPDIVEVI